MKEPRPFDTVMMLLPKLADAECAERRRLLLERASSAPPPKRKRGRRRKEQWFTLAPSVDR